jgi:hypothetical protein
MYMSELFLSPKQAWHTTWNFFYAMLEECPDRFLNHGRGYMMFENFLDDQLEGFQDCVWGRCYSATSLKPRPYDLEMTSLETTISPEEVFATIIAVVCEYSYLYGFRMFEFIELLHRMRCKPEQYPKECKIWDEAIQEALQ